MRSSCLGVLATLLVTTLLPHGAGAVPSISFSTVVLQGSAAPDLPGLTLSSLQNFALGEGGHVAFHAVLAGPGVNPQNRIAAFRWNADGSRELLARQESPVPDSPGLVFQTLNGFSYQLADDGETLVGGVVRETSSGTTWAATFALEDGQSSRLVAKNGDAAPGAPPGVTFSGVGARTVMNGAGQVAFESSLSDGGRGIWLGDDQGGLELVALRGQQAPGFSAGVTFDSVEFYDVDASGRTLFSTRLAGPGMTSTHDQVLWLRDASGSFAPLLREGDAVPGLPAGTVVGPVAALNPSTTLRGLFGDGNDALVLQASLAGPAVTLDNDGAFFFGSPAQPLGLVLREGDAAPGTGPGVVFDELPDVAPPVLNADGRGGVLGLLTGAGVDSTNYIGVWRRDSAGDLDLVARMGDLVPGLVGVTFLEIDTHLDGNVFADFVFRSSLGNAPTSRDQALFVSLANGELVMLAREGDVIEVAPGDFRTILEIEGVQSGDTLNDQRQVTFGVRFVGGTRGILQASVPEPAAAALLFAVLGRALVRTRRR